MIYLRTIGKILLLTSLFAAGLVASRLIIYGSGLVIPRLPMQADEVLAIPYLVTGSLIICTALYLFALNIGGNRTTRFMVIFPFFYIAFGVCVTIESAIYSDVEGYGLMALVFLLPTLLTSLGLAIVDKPVPGEIRLHGAIIEYFRTRKLAKWLSRYLLALLSFPTIYLLLGILVSPFVKEYYEGLSKGLYLPEIKTIISVQVIRSSLFIIVTLPALLYWRNSKRNLIVSLAIAHFTFVFAFDIVLAIEMPVKLVLIHGTEILAGSFIYSAIFVKLISAGNGIMMFKQKAGSKSGN